ncbi:amidohydrolase family protein [Flavobacterium soli]|uniref:amidohydrolase family protein n=1 Tax=Flavobacterium soli TaxID=344881 RepID=UPI0009FE5372|nr:amidohydrolase family protein [Flavobacterium soli]
MQKIVILITLILSNYFISHAQEPDFLIKNVSIISMKDNTVLKNQMVAIKDGQIIEIADKTRGRAKQTIDAKGKFIMPSLSDAHVHFPSTEKEMEIILKLNLINGVTKLRSMRGDWNHYSWRQKYNSIDSYYPKLYLSPPPISRGQDLTLVEMESFVKASKERNLDLIKILSIKNQSMFKQLDSICKIYKMSLAGHYPRLASGNEVNEDVIFNSSYTSFEHLGGLAGENTETIQRRISLLKKKSITICPTLSWYSVGSGRYTTEESRKMPGMEFVSKAKMEEWIEGTEKYREKMGVTAYKEEVVNELKALDQKYKIIKQLNEAGVPMLLSPDASSKYMIAGFSVLGEMNLLKNTELSNYEILKMATVNFATFFKENFGTIEVGKNADFILLDGNPLEDLKTLENLQGVYYNQHFLDKNALNTMRNDILKTVQK